MRKLWVKAWMTLDGVFDADTMDHWWPPAQEAATDHLRNALAGLVHTDDRRWSRADPQPHEKICGLDYARNRSLERVHQHQRKCGGRNHQTETAAGQRHYYRWQCHAGPLADGNGSDRRVPVLGLALRHGKGKAILP